MHSSMKQIIWQYAHIHTHIHEELANSKEFYPDFIFNAHLQPEFIPLAPDHSRKAVICNHLYNRKYFTWSPVLKNSFGEEY